MTLLAYKQHPPAANEAVMARLSGQLLSPYAHRSEPLTVRVREAELDKTIELPPDAVTLLIEILEAMAAGRGVKVVQENAELTTFQAADILNVSRPFLIRLLEDNAIPHRKVGKHRRVRLEDVMAYKTRIDKEREKVLDQLVREAQEEGMGYEAP